jgi:hypothetical protein
MFCTYLTIYSGDKLPRRYIGSTATDKVFNGYHGSVKSKRYRETWEKEIEENPSLFKTRVLTLHETREEAIQKEKELHLFYDVVKSDLYINESVAQPNGFFGRDVSGENNPNYGNGEAIKKWSKANPEKASERNRKAALTQWSDKEGADKKRLGMIGKKRTRKTQTQEEFEKMQGEKGKRGAEGLRQKKSYRIFYNDKTYYGFAQFEQATGINKWFAKKMANDGQIKIEKP